MPLPNPKVLKFDPPPQRILLILPTWVGDVVMATPFISALAQRFPEASLTLVMFKHLSALLDDNPHTKSCQQIFWPPRNNSAEAKAAHKQFIAQLKAQKFDLAVTLPNSLRSAWLCFRVGAKRRVGYARDGRGILLTDRIQVPNKRTKAEQRATPAPMPPGPYAPLPLVEYYAQLALALGCDHPGDDIKLFTNSADEQALQTRLAQAQVDPNKPLVVLCPGANFGASKCWPPERFAAVADALVRQRAASIAISPGPGEEPLAQAIADHMQEPNLLLTQPCTTLGELKALIKQADLLLGNDTGPRHFARAFNTPRVTVFGPTEQKWTDTSHHGERIVRVDVPCGPCHQKVCPLEQQICMLDVTVDMVLKACNQMLAAPPSADSH